MDGFAARPGVATIRGSQRPALGRRVCECGLRVLLRAGIVGKRLRKGRGDNGEPRLAR